MPRRRRPNRFVRGFQIGGFCNLLGVLAAGGCIRFTSDVPPDASQDASNDVAEEITPESGPDSRADARDESIILDASLAKVDAPDAPSDVTIDVAPTCQRFDPSIRLAIASDLVSTLLQDCKIRSAFASLPPVRLQHLEECFAAQVASVLGCVHPDGTRYKYPAYDSNGQFCRDMKTAHAGVTASDGDFDAFTADIALALMKNGLADDEVTRALRSFGASTTRADIVKLKDAGPTQPACDAGTSEAGPDARADSSADVGPDASPDVGPDAAMNGDAPAD
jgi:hypothetical protein